MQNCDQTEQEKTRIFLGKCFGTSHICYLGKSSGLSHPCRETWCRNCKLQKSFFFFVQIQILTHRETHDINLMSQIGHLKKGLNPPSVSELKMSFGSTHLPVAIKTGIITGIIALAVSSKI